MASFTYCKRLTATLIVAFLFFLWNEGRA